MIFVKLGKTKHYYDIRLNWILTYRCNLNCVHCLSNFLKKAAEISKINIPAMLRTLNGTNKTFKINFTGGGEPFLIPNFVEACKEITKSHLISFNTNLTYKKVKEFAEKIDPERVTYIVASCHIKELERLNLLDTYISNFHICKEKGFNIKAIEVAHPQLLDEVEKYKRFFQENGIDLKFNPFIGLYNGKIYPDLYTNKQIKIFGLNVKDKNFCRQKGKLCIAGYNVGIINPNGYISYCNKLHKPMGNIYYKIKFNDKMIRCPFKFCECPLNVLNPYLLKKAKEETNLNILNPIFLKKHVLMEYLKKIVRRIVPYDKHNQIVTFIRKHGFVLFDY